MNKALLFSLLTAGSFSSFAQTGISITASDMPVAGDTLRWSAANVLTAGINLNTTGTNQVWNFSSITPVAQGIDQYKTAIQVNPLYASIAVTAYGYKVADSLPGASALPGGISVKDVYTFFNKKSSPSRFVAEGFAATVGPLPVPAPYQQEDTIFRFPLAYGNATVNSVFYLKASIATIGSLAMGGTRKTTVDGWGTIQTPYTAGAVSCIRVKSEVNEIDTVTIGGQAMAPIVRNTVEYRWLANGEHYPLMIVTTTKAANGTETPTSVRYRDTRRTGLLSVASVPSIQELRIVPNPAYHNALVEVPAAWNTYTVEVFDIAGTRVYSATNSASIPVHNLAAGTYLVRVMHGNEVGLSKLTK